MAGQPLIVVEPGGSVRPTGLGKQGIVAPHMPFPVVAALHPIERRGPDRTRKVTRPVFKTMVASVPKALAAPAATARTGVDDEWAAF